MCRRDLASASLIMFWLPSPDGRRSSTAIAVTVGNQMIALSDVIRDLRISALLDQKPLDLSGAQKTQGRRAPGGSGPDP